jgi:hypothetical protein
LQLSLLYYAPKPHLPTRADRQAGAAMVTYLRTIDGAVLAPFEPLLPRLAGKPGNAHEQALFDVQLGGGLRPDAARSLASSVERALRAQRYAAVVLDHAWWSPELQRSYRRTATSALPTGNAMFPRTGAATRPTMIWMPKH